MVGDREERGERRKEHVHHIRVIFGFKYDVTIPSHVLII